MRGSRLILIGMTLIGLLAGVPARAQECLDCHNDPKLTKDVGGKPVSVAVIKEQFEGSVHGVLGCTDCHSDVKEYPHEPAPARVDCSGCHPDATAAYAKGLHAQAIKRGDRKAATCFDCHGAPHAILPSSNPKSKTYRSNLPETCGGCHGVNFVMEPAGFSTQPFFSYRESVHGRAVENGSKKAAVCTDCHGNHDIRPPGDPTSPIFKFNVPRTCGQCHPNVTSQYAESIHGKAVARGNWQSPVCTDCHGIHAIKAHIDPASTVYSVAIARTTCAQCHGGVRLTQEFGVASKRVSTYRDSYHGLATSFGSSVAANCASCHGVHNILPSSDPRSMINRRNLVKTCGACHPGAGVKFTQGKIHLDVPAGRDMAGIIVRWIRWFYITLIVATIGGMLLHNLIIWWRKASAKRKDPHRTFVRMSRRERIQHLLFLISFFVLVVTGFALAYPNSWISALLGSSEKVRSIGHRAAAVLMLAVSAYHVWYMLATPQGRKGLRDFWPRLRDARDVIANMRHYINRSVPHPRFARFSYAEKAEYWALIWGTVVMAITGLSLWFKVEFSHFFARWWIDVATAIHFYEAILATLAIIVWHFYQVIFDPDTYPMNWAWLDGKMTPEAYEHEHAEAYEAERKTAVLESVAAEEQGQDDRGEPRT